MHAHYVAGVQKVREYMFLEISIENQRVRHIFDHILSVLRTLQESFTLLIRF
jgi:hypothetical protein